MVLERRLVPDIRTLQTFECAARHGNFTRAAEELHLTQSAVSRQVRELEEQLGTVLFERVRTRVVLTGAGQRLLEQARRLMEMAEATMRQAAAGDDDGRTLAVAVLPTFAGRWLLPRLPRFLAAHPGAHVDLASHLGPFDFTAGQSDLAVHFGQPVWPQAACTYLCSEVVVPVAAPALRAGAATAEALLAAPRLHLSTRPHLWTEWFTARGLAAPQALKGHWFDQFSMVIAAAVAGLGHALLPLYLIEAELAQGSLEVVLDAPWATDNAYWVVLPEGRSQRPLVEAFRDWLLAEVREHPVRLPQRP